MTTGHDRQPLRFATFLAPNLLPVYRFLAEQISHRLGRPVELVVGTSLDQLERGQADLGVICGLPYVWLADRRPSPVEPLAGPVLTGERYAGRPIYYSDVIVHRDSPITRIQELQGRSWAYNEPASHSGHSLTLYALVRMAPGLASSPASWRRVFTSAPSGWSPAAGSTRPRSTPRSWPWSSATIPRWPPACG
jgi:ABC transporter, phosphonate, periplasmic substrate-binding protein